MLADVAQSQPVSSPRWIALRHVAPEVAYAAYNVAREAIFNSMRHSSCDSVVLRLEVVTGWLVLEVTDNGVGIAGSVAGHGRTSMLDRVSEVSSRCWTDHSSGLAAIPEVKSIAPRIGRLKFSILAEDPHGVNAIVQGTDGFVTKLVDPRIFLEAVSHVATGGKFVSSSIAELHTRRVRRTSDLTSRELENFDTTPSDSAASRSPRDCRSVPRRSARTRPTACASWACSLRRISCGGPLNTGCHRAPPGTPGVGGACGA